MRDHRKKMVALLACLSVTSMFVFSSCRGNNNPPATETTTAAATTQATESTTTAATTTQATESTTTAAETEASTEAQTDETEEKEDATVLVGSPWLTSFLSGNITAEIPDRNDDVYLYYNYDYMKENEGNTIIELSSHSNELTNCVMEIMSDKSKTSPELEQLRIFFSQAADSETLAKQGLSEIMPYIERIQNVSSIEEMNTLITSEDFPFSPFLLTTICSYGKDIGNVIALYPNFLFMNPIVVGGQFYAAAEKPSADNAVVSAAASKIGGLVVDLMSMGTEKETAREQIISLLDFEGSYGKYVSYMAKYQTMEYGAYAEEYQECLMSLDDIAELCPAFPIKDVLATLKMDSAKNYNISTHEWLEVFNEAWTDENIDTLKLYAIASVLNETQPFRDHTALDEMSAASGVALTDPVIFAYDSCNNLNTFSQLIAKLYATECLGEKCKERLTNLTKDILDTYKTLMNETSWLSEESLDDVIGKLDNMTLNILEPASGYFDYSDVKLVPTEEGGTLLGNYFILKDHCRDEMLKMLNSNTIVEVAWYVFSPADVNAFYDPNTNSINILPGYVTSLVYKDEMDDSELMGAIGTTIGHEISHAFDYSGSQFNGYAEPKPIYKGSDLEHFMSICDKLSDYYSSFETEPGVYYNGKNVVAEATADLSGVQAILTLAEKRDDIDLDKLLDSFSLLYAEVIPASVLPIFIVDSHPLNNYRVNVNVQMFDIVYDTFGITEGDGMYLAPEDRIVLWGEKAS